MSYRCEITGKQSKPCQKLHKITVLTRPQTYYKYVKNEETRIWEKVFAATGTEIVKELCVSEEGMALWATYSPEDKANFLKNLG